MRRGMNTLSLQVQQDLGAIPMRAIFLSSEDAKAIWSKSYGTTVWAPRSTRSVWSGGDSCGRRRRTGLCRSLRHSSATCSKASTGATRFGPGGRCGPVEPSQTVAWAAGPSQELPGGGGCDSLPAMTATDSHDAEALKAALAASEARAAAAEAQIAALRLMIEKLRRALYGRRSERTERLLDQLELALDELTARRERGRRSQPFDAGRPSGCLHGGSEAAARPDRGPCAGGFASARRRHDRAGAGQGQDRHRAGLGLCARRRAVRRSGPAGGRCSATRGIDRAITRSSICTASPGSCRPTPTPGTGGSTRPADHRGP